MIRNLFAILLIGTVGVVGWQSGGADALLQVINGPEANSRFPTRMNGVPAAEPTFRGDYRSGLQTRERPLLEQRRRPLRRMRQSTRENRRVRPFRRLRRP